MPPPHLDGCLDVDLEPSAKTNALPVRRMGLASGAGAAAPTSGLSAWPYNGWNRPTRAPDEAASHSYDYTAPAFGFARRIAYDESGLVLKYPRIAVRTG